MVTAILGLIGIMFLFAMPIIAIIIIIKFLSGINIKSRINTRSEKGKIGENETISHLKNNNEKYILKNIYIPKDEKSSTEIDVLCINEKGIFVYESKNYSGWIFGHESDNTWTQTLKGGKKFHFYNPIKQNKNHITFLKEFLNKPNIRIYSIIVFSNHCEFKNITAKQENYSLIKYFQLPNYIQYYNNNYPDCMDETTAKEIYLKLLPLEEQQFNNISV